MDHAAPRRRGHLADDADGASVRLLGRAAARLRLVGGGNAGDEVGAQRVQATDAKDRARKVRRAPERRARADVPSQPRERDALVVERRDERRVVGTEARLDRVRQALISRYVAAARLGLGMRMNAVVNNAAAAVAIARLEEPPRPAPLGDFAVVVISRAGSEGCQNA